MKYIYAVVPDYDYDGMGKPDWAFETEEQALEFIASRRRPGYYQKYEVVEVCYVPYGNKEQEDI